MPSAIPRSLPEHRTAIVAKGPGKLVIKRDAVLPTLTPDMIMVKTAAVALNPVDIKLLDYSAAPGAVVGVDFAGVVAALGADVAAVGRLAVGDRVAGAMYGMDKLKPEVGAFAEYVGVPADLVLKIPDHMSFEDASGLGLGVATAMYGLFSELGLPASVDHIGEGEEPGEFVLVAGGATASGTRAIQLLKIAGFRPIATCSPSNDLLVKRFGAEKIFDYHSPTCAEDIRAYTRNQLEFAFDCVSEAETTQLCYDSIGRAGGRYVALEPFRESVTQTRATVEASWFLVMTVWGRKIDLDGEFAREASPDDRAFGTRSFAAMQKLMDQGLVDTHPVKVLSGGWEGVIQGIDQMRSQPPSGCKLVYTV